MERRTGGNWRGRAALMASVLLAMLLTAVLALRTLTSSPSASGAPAPLQRRLLVIGIDGLEWEILRPLLAGNEVPHLAGLMESGTRGYLRTLEPTLSPVIWTTIATGKAPEAHGILNFTLKDAATGRERLFTSRDRQVKALWNILSGAGRSVNVIGWWNTWPVEPINGVMISQFSSLDQGKRVWKGTVREDWPAQCWPDDYYDVILPVVREVKEQYPESIDPAAAMPPHLSRFLSSLPESPTPFEVRLFSDSVWAFRADETYVRIAEQVLRQRPADATFVYLGSPDVAGHRFYRHYRPDAFLHSPRAAAIEAFADVIPASYRFVDEMVGRLLEAAGEQTDVLVLSDHGMSPVNTERDFEAAFVGSNPRYQLASVNSGHHLQGESGVIIASGASFAARPDAGAKTTWRAAGLPTARLDTLGSVFDVTPTILHLLGLPVGRDMNGVVMSTVLSDSGPASHPVAQVPSYEEDTGPKTPADPFPGIDSERLRQLRSLGYVE